MNAERRFYFRLAGHLGKTVKELENDLGEGELEEWKAFHYFEPFGAPAEDDRTRLISTLLWQSMARKDAVMPDWLDRDPEETHRLRRIHKLLSMEDESEAFFSRLAKKSQKAKKTAPPAPVEASPPTPLVEVEPHPVIQTARSRKKKPTI